LSQQKLFTLLVCDKAHTIPLHRCSFRRDFIKMRKDVLKFVFTSNPSLCVLSMSASFCLQDQSKYSSIMSVKPAHMFWGPMDCRGIILVVSMNGDVAGSISNEIMKSLSI
jgi:hypothetical protein